jgi:hypothetical protein
MRSGARTAILIASMLLALVLLDRMTVGRLDVDQSQRPDAAPAWGLTACGHVLNQASRSRQRRSALATESHWAACHRGGSQSADEIRILGSQRGRDLPMGTDRPCCDQVVVNSPWMPSL